MVEGPLLLLIIGLAVVFIVLSTSVFKIHPFLALLLACFGVGIAVRMPLADIGTTIAAGFGSLMGSIGLVVVLGSIIGVALERSGAALRIADAVLNLVGPTKPALAMSVIGLIVGIPVFCDSGFILLSGINRALAQRSKLANGSLTIALASGLYTSHTLIPPTPGPIAAAGNLGASEHLGTVILVGLAISIPVVLVAYIYAIVAAKKLGTIPTTSVVPEATSETESIPGLLKSLAPILVPILLISLASVTNILAISPAIAAALNFLGSPLIALLFGVGLSIFLLPHWHASAFSGWVSEGILQAGPILILTGAGGAFGALLKATPVAALVGEWLSNNAASGSFLLVISFIIAALLKTSQGSTTSALVITSSMLAPLLTTIGFDTGLELSLLVAAIGAGAMVVSHANDSYFWVITQFSGLTVKEAYQGFTIVTFLQGLTALVCVLLVYYLFC
ncbi:GntP family permease [Adhaeribacter rhizoryzae]|uniref:GntP family permease n=1 Tax=Adhaeribacter rhizoryzae TaxID=2607907 RepID=A0A5M6DCA7_9BACT|nr:GntP family permease [Adhaeribacter rhizoryzae]KAA5544020.1 GntP family permease [Adhaeribacter rhizoryzae]